MPVAEFSARRVAAIAAIAGALVGGAVAGGVTVASTGGTHDSTSSSPDSNGSLTTAAVVRATLSTSVQVSGSIGYEGSYAIGAPSGASAQEVDQDQLAVTKDQQSLSADGQAETDAATSDNQAIAADQANVTADQSTLSADQATQAQDCAGSGASTPACNSDAQKVSQDRAQLIQAQQQLAAAQTTTTRDHDQNQAKVASDQTALAGDQAILKLAQASAQNPGTTYTALPSVGDVIKEDQSVYSVSDELVPLLYGTVAAYRAFYIGMSDGTDVGELTADLIALGYGAGMTQSNHYSSATAAAVERWQRALGAPCDRRDHARRRGFRARPHPGDLGHAFGRLVRRGRRECQRRGRGHRPHGHEHYPHRHTRPRRESGVSGEARRRGLDRPARRHLERWREHRDGRQCGHLRWWWRYRIRHWRHQRQQHGRPVDLLVGR